MIFFTLNSFEELNNYHIQDSSDPIMGVIIELNNPIQFYLLAILFSILGIILLMIRNIDKDYGTFGIFMEVLGAVIPGLFIILIACPLLPSFGSPLPSLPSLPSLSSLSSSKLLYGIDKFISEDDKNLVPNLGYGSYQYVDFLNDEEEYVNYDSGPRRRPRIKLKFVYSQAAPGDSPIDLTGDSPGDSPIDLTGDSPAGSSGDDSSDDKDDNDNYSEDMTLGEDAIRNLPEAEQIGEWHKLRTEYVALYESYHEDGNKEYEDHYISKIDAVDAEIAALKDKGYEDPADYPNSPTASDEDN